LRKVFLTGLFVLIPIVLTALALWLLFAFLDGLLSPLFSAMTGLHLPGLGFASTLVLIFLVGILASNVVGGRILGWWESWISRIPVVGRIYDGVKQTLDAFSPDHRSAFQEFVLVRQKEGAQYLPGFVTGRITLDATPVTELVSVYVPTNHLYLGQIVVVRDEDIWRPGISVGEGVRIVLSAGISFPREIKG
jgi:uncharacterized membrane protein